MPTFWETETLKIKASAEQINDKIFLKLNQSVQCTEVELMRACHIQAKQNNPTLISSLRDGDFKM